MKLDLREIEKNWEKDFRYYIHLSLHTFNKGGREMLIRVINKYKTHIENPNPTFKTHITF